MASTDFLVNYGKEFYPFGFIFIIIFLGIIAYAITRYRLMDIRLAMSRAIIYILTIVAVAAAAFLLLYFISLSFPELNIYAALAVAVFAAILFQPLFFFFESVSRKYLFYSLYNYRQTLIDLGGKLSATIDLEQIVNAITSTMIDTMKLDRAGVLLVSGEGKDKSYTAAKIIGFKENNGISLVKDNFLTNYLEKKKRLLVYEEVALLAKRGVNRNERENFARLEKHLKKIEAALCLPLIQKGKLTGLIVLGKKISGDAYTGGDLELLTTLASQASIALQNAQLYHQVQDLNQTLNLRVQNAVKDLKELYEMKSSFLTVASHQLRTPTSIVRGMLSLINDPQIPKEQKGKLCRQALTGADNLEMIIRDILTAAELDAGRMEAKSERIDLAPLVMDMIKTLKPVAEKKGIKLVYTEPKNKIPPVFADSTKLGEAMRNLVDNAIKYTAKGQVAVTLEALPEAGKVHFKVQDTGIGMTAKDIKNLTSKFYRGEGVLKVQPNGSGLGLFITRGIVEAANGHLTFKSAGKDKGSTFEIFLPAADK